MRPQEFQRGSRVAERMREVMIEDRARKELPVPETIAVLHMVIGVVALVRQLAAEAVGCYSAAMDWWVAGIDKAVVV